MDHFLYKDGALHAEDVPVAEIAAAVGTPFYLYSTATLLRHFKLFDDALEGLDHLVCYAMKAASNQAIPFAAVDQSTERAGWRPAVELGALFRHLYSFGSNGLAR